MAYDAFISYSHAADSELGAALQRALHRLARPWYRLRALHVFRDKTSLAASPALWPSILAALSHSSYFLLLASPAAARSLWVRREVEWWRQNKALDHFLIAITDGELAWDPKTSDFDWTRTDCLPRELEGGFAAEPLWVDLRSAKHRDEMSLRHSAFRLAILDLAAPIHARPKDELDGEDVRQHRRARITAWSAAIALAALTIVSTITAFVAWEQNRIGRSRELAALSVAQLQSDPDVALLLSLEAIGVRQTPSAESALRRAVGRHYLRRTLDGHRRPVRAVALSRDGRWLASADYEESVHLWDLSSGQNVRSWMAEGVNSLAFASDARLLVASVERSAVAWDTSTGAPVAQAPAARDEVQRALFEPQRKLWVLVDEDDGLLAPDEDADGRGWRRLGGTADQLLLVDDGRTLITANDSFARFWDVESWKLLGEVELTSFEEGRKDPPKEAKALGVVASPSIRLIEGRLVVAKYRSGEAFTLFDGQRGSSITRSTDPAGRWLARGSVDGSVELWSVDSQTRFRDDRGHTRPVRAVAVSTDGQVVASAGEDNRIRVWRSSVADERWNAGGTSDLHARLAAAGAHGLVVAATYRGPVQLLDATSGTKRADITGNFERPECLAVSAEGQVLVGADEGVWLWRPERGATRVSDGRPNGCAFRGEVPAWTTSAGGVVIGDTVLPAPEKPDRGEGGASLGDSIFNPTATHLVAQGELGRAFVWDLAQPRPREVAFPGEEFSVLEIAPDGRSFYACSNFGPVRRFDTASLALVQEIVLGSLSCRSLAASPNGRYLAAGGAQGEIVVFTTVDGAPVKSLHTAGGVESMRFGVESRTLVVAENGRVHLFDCDACLEAADLITLARARVTRPLSADERTVHLGAASLLAQLRGLLR